MNKIRAALFGMVILTGLSGAAVAQGGAGPQGCPPPGAGVGGGGGGGGFGGRGRGGPPPLGCYNQFFAEIRVSQAQQAKITAIGNAYSDSLNVVMPARGGGPGGGGAAPGGPPTPFSALPDSVQKKAMAIVDERNKAFEAILTPAQKKDFDNALAADAKLRGAAPGGGGGNQ